MKRLKTLLWVALVALGFAGLYNAEAAWNLRQISSGKTAGGAEFVPTQPGLAPARIGRTIITHTIPNLNVAATHYLLSPITGRLREVLLVPDTTLATEITVSAFLDRSLTSSVFYALAPTGRILTGQATGDGLALKNLFMRSTNEAASNYNDSEWVASGITGFIEKAAVKQYRPIVVRIGGGSGSASTNNAGNLVVIIDPE